MIFYTYLYEARRIENINMADSSKIYDIKSAEMQPKNIILITTCTTMYPCNVSVTFTSLKFQKKTYFFEVIKGDEYYIMTTAH